MNTCEPTRYHVFGVCRNGDFSLFVDYIVDDLDGHRQDLLRRLYQASDQRAVHSWLAEGELRAVDIFEIECVNNKSAARDAVVFWRAYFRALGEIIIDADHLGDR